MLFHFVTQKWSASGVQAGRIQKGDVLVWLVSHSAIIAIWEILNEFLQTEEKLKQHSAENLADFEDQPELLGLAVKNKS